MMECQDYIFTCGAACKLVFYTSHTTVTTMCIRKVLASLLVPADIFLIAACALVIWNIGTYK